MLRILFFIFWYSGIFLTYGVTMSMMIFMFFFFFVFDFDFVFRLSLNLWRLLYLGLAMGCIAAQVRSMVWPFANIRRNA
jgi:hypothetical protein